MKRILSILAVLLLLSGCMSDAPARQTEPSAHEHFAPQVRQETLFYLEEEEQAMCTMYYLSYREPDGCSTRIYSFMNEKPKLYACEGAFYYIWNGSATLERVSFTGDHSTLNLDNGSAIAYIVRTAQDGIYCAIDQGDGYICVSLDLSTWEDVSAEQALTA